MNQEVINFEEELLGYEADSLNPPDGETKGMSFMNSKRIRKLSFEEMEVENVQREKSKLKSKNEKNDFASTVKQIQNGYKFFSRKFSEDKDGATFNNFSQSIINTSTEEKYTTEEREHSKGQVKSDAFALLGFIF